MTLNLFLNTYKQRPLPLSFFARPACVVAPALLGKRLVRWYAGERLAGRIIETEAYCEPPEPDLACHAHRANNGRPTPRTAVMFGPPGVAYIYFTYGVHWLFNIVTGQEGVANAVLIRALEPLEGEVWFQKHRPGRRREEWMNGPAKLTQALVIGEAEKGTNLCAPDGVIWVEDAPDVGIDEIATGPRVGLGQTPEPSLSRPWRYWLKK